jgi:hypothetical protein
MNTLDKIKQQLMIKPNVKERERVAVIIHGEKPGKKSTTITKKKATQKEDQDDEEEDEQEQ